MTDLENLRKAIDEINHELILLFAKRLKITKQIAAIKKERDLPILDPEREKQLIHRIRDDSLAQGIKPEIMEKIFGLYIDYTREEMR